MWQVGLRRLLWAIPTLIAVSVVAFLFGQWATDDPLMVAGGTTFTQSTLDPRAQHDFYRRQAQTFGLDLPNFYFECTTNTTPDTLSRIFPVLRRERLMRLAALTGNWPQVQHWESMLGQLIRRCEALPDSLFSSITERNALFNQLVAADNLSRCDSGWAQLLRYAAVQSDTLRAAWATEWGAFDAARQQLKPDSGWRWPRVIWHGTANQYHRRIGDLLSGSTSEIWKKLGYPLRVTLLVNVLALLLAALIALSLAPMLVRYWDQPIERGSKWVLLLLYAMPTIVIGCLLRYAFATPGQGFFLKYIGSVNTPMFDPATMQFWDWAGQNHAKFILPVLTLTLHFGAMLTLQLRNDLLGELRKPYIRTARAKGLTEMDIIERHAKPNAQFPFVVGLGTLFPIMVGGMVITESIFNIHGMGEVMLNAFRSNDFPMMMTIVLLTAVLTILVNLVVDMLNSRGKAAVD
jgi:peptide/nickel transport system permease protein